MNTARFKLVFPLSLVCNSVTILGTPSKQNLSPSFALKDLRRLPFPTPEFKVMVEKFNRNFHWLPILKYNLLIPGKCTATRPIFLTVYDYYIQSLDRV